MARVRSIPCLVDWQMLIADCDPCTLLLGTPRHFRLNIHVDCSVQSLSGRAAAQGQAVEALLSCIPMAFMSGRVWAAKISVDGRVPLKIEGSRFDRHSLYRLGKLCAYFSGKLHFVTKLAFFRLTVHIYITLLYQGVIQ